MVIIKNNFVRSCFLYKLVNKHRKCKYTLIYLDLLYNSMKKIIVLMSFLVSIWWISSATNIVWFDFNNGTKTWTITNNTTWNTPWYTADTGIVGNVNTRKISLVWWPTFSAWVQWVDGLNASAPNTVWRNTWALTKYWMFDFGTIWYGNLTLFSKQQSSPTWPRDFKVQYSTWWTIWTDVIGGWVLVDNSFTSWVVNWITLPSLLNNQSIVYLRWIMTTNTWVNGSATSAAGTQRIDNILVLWELIFSWIYTGSANWIVSWNLLQSITSGSNGTTVVAIPNTGYSFVNRSDGSTANPRTDVNVTWNINVVANFAQNQYLVTFQDYNATLLSTWLILHGSSAIAPVNPIRTGYTFSGWDQNFSFVTWDMTIIAQYNINQYTITFDTTWWSLVNPISGDYNTVVVAPTNPTKTWFIFSGWLPLLPSTMPAQNMTLVAQWHDNQLPVITLMWSASMTINLWSIYTESWASWTDNVDGSGTNVIISGSVNTSLVGTYVLEYKYTDAAWNVWVATRTVNVVDQTPPHINTWSISINEWDSLTINVASLTTDNWPISQYDFDIDNNGTTDFSNSSGIITLTWNQLQSFGIIWNNTTLLPTDVYKIGLKAIDNWSNIGTGVFQLKVYNIAPIVNIVSPILSWYIYTGNLPIQWMITDPADQDFPMNTDIFYSNNGSTYVSLSTTTSNRTWEIIWDTTTVSDWANYRIRIRSIDDYGNNTTTSIPFKIDHTWPVVSGQFNYTIAEWSGVVFVLTGTSDAIAGLSGFVWTINSTTTGTATGLLSLSRSELEWLGIVNDWVYSIWVQAIDAVGNTTSKTLSLNIANTPPTVVFTGPVAGIYSGNVGIYRNANDVASGDLPVYVKISYTNGVNSWVITQWTGVVSPYQRNVSSIPDGTGYSIRIVVSDDDSSTTATWTLFSIDHTAPTINWFSWNYTINEWSGVIIDIRTTTDAIAWLSGGVAMFSGSINGIALPSNTSGYRNLSWTNLATYGISNWSWQSYPLIIQSTDAIGNTRLATWTLVVNNIAPSISIAPIANTVNVVGTIPLQRSTSDPIDTPLLVNIYYWLSPNGPRTFLSSWQSTTFTGLLWNTTTVNDWWYYVKATATDDKDTTTTTLWPITINNISDYVWWGGGWSSSVDYCPNGDYSSSYYDGICGTKPITTGLNQTGIQFSPTDIFNEDIKDGYCYTRNGSTVIQDSSSLITSDEFRKSLAFLYTYTMTKYNNVDWFEPYSNLTREQAAKLFANFATNVLCRKPDTSLQPNYIDVKTADSTLLPYITKAYQLGLMKGWNNKFRPTDNITKIEVNAILIRMLLKAYLPEPELDRALNYNSTSKTLWIMTKTSLNPITRYDAALMMFRAYKNQNFSLQNIDYESYVLANRTMFVK